MGNKTMSCCAVWSMQWIRFLGRVSRMTLKKKA